MHLPLRSPGHRLAAFTMIELLSTIAIIAALAALLLAGSRNMRRSGAQAATVSNLRNIGLGIHQYVADNDTRLPGPLTVAVYNWVDTNTENTICSLGRYIYPYLGASRSEPWLSYQTRSHFPVLDCPALSQAARTSEAPAQFVKLDYPPASEDNIFGSPPPGGAPFSSRGAVNPQPKLMGALTDKARKSAILTTADQASWAVNALLPAKGVFNGKRLYLFLDGSVEGPVAQEGIWSR